MKKPLCSVYLSLTPDMHSYLKKKLQRKYRVHLSTDTLNNTNIEKDTEILCTFVDSHITKSVLQKMPKLRLIATLSTGFDHIDLRQTKKKKITVCNVPSYGERTVAEFTIGLILSLSRNLYKAVRRVKTGNFDYHGLRGIDLHKKTIGIIGTGKIGSNVIRMLQGFGTTIIAYDKFPKKDLAKDLGFTYVPLSTIWKASDIISLHTPLLKSTRHIINKKSIQKMKPGVTVINTARGGLVSSEALLWGLESGIIAKAGLDVLEQEDLLEDTFRLLEKKSCTIKNTRICLMNNILIDHPNTIVTPHLAFNSSEAVLRIIDTSLDNIAAFAKGKPQHIVTKK